MKPIIQAGNTEGVQCVLDTWACLQHLFMQAKTIVIMKCTVDLKDSTKNRW